MHCHVCNVAVGDGQKFCNSCGQSLAGVTDPTEPMPAIDDVTIATFDADSSADATDGSRSELGVLGGLPPRSASDETAIDGRTEADDIGHRPTQPVDLTGQPPTELIDLVDDSAGPVVAMEEFESTPIVVVDPVEPDAASPATAAPYDTGLHDLATADPVVHESTTAMPVTASAGDGAIDTAIPPVFDGASDVAPAPVETEGFRLRAALVFSLLAVITVLMTSVADIIDIRTSRPVDGIAVGLRQIDTFGTNLTVAGFIGAALMFVGGLLSCFGLRWGAGLAGGAGLSLVGWSAIVLGLAEIPIHDAQSVTRDAGSEIEEFTLSVTRDLGWFLVVAVAALGLVVFVSSSRMAGVGGRRGLNPWIAALGALAVVIAAVGPLVPLAGQDLGVNLAVSGFPRAFFAGRIVQVALLAVTGVIGFLSVRNYGLGFAAGGVGLSIWLWVTALIDFGARPVSVAVGNIGSDDTTPHAVTTVGFVSAIALLLVAVTLSFATRRRA